jgi:probable HAF family extracellular repeat protein
MDHLFSRTLLIAAIVFAGASAVAHADPITYSFTTLDVPGSAAGTTEVYGINDQGQVVGIFGQAGVGFRGFLYSGGSFTTLSVAGADFTTGYDINNSGSIVGTSGSSSGLVSHGFLSSEGTVTPIDVPGASKTSLSGINDLGQMVGGYVDASGRSHGFLSSNGNITTIDVPVLNPNAVGALATINNQGEIVGTYYSAAGSPLGFKYANGNFSTISLGNTTNAYGINDRGQISGSYSDASGSHGFVLGADGGLTTIDVPGVFPVCPFVSCVASTSVFGINNLGQVVGTYGDGTGTHAFLGTPVPEPSSSVLVLLGLSGLTVWRRRQSRLVVADYRRTRHARRVSLPASHAADDPGGYLTWTMMKSTGLPLVFFDSCATPRPMKDTSPRAHEVFAGLPSIDNDIGVGPSAMTT